MARRRTHTEAWWANNDGTVLRCSGHNKSDGERCKAEAHPGTTVCDRHGALIPAVQATAAIRIQESVDDVVTKLLAMANDPTVEHRDKIRILHDFLDRGGLAATSKVLVGVVNQDPVERLFLDLLTKPGVLAAPQPEQSPDPRFEEFNRAALTAAGDDIVEAEIVEDRPAIAKRPRRVRSSNSPPKHIREGIARAEQLKRLL